MPARVYSFTWKFMFSLVTNFTSSTVLHDITRSNIYWFTSFRSIYVCLLGASLRVDNLYISKNSTYFKPKLKPHNSNLYTVRISMCVHSFFVYTVKLCVLWYNCFQKKKVYKYPLYINWETLQHLSVATCHHQNEIQNP